jgi:hypothetical protein
MTTVSNIELLMEWNDLNAHAFATFATKRKDADNMVNMIANLMKVMVIK